MMLHVALTISIILQLLFCKNQDSRNVVVLQRLPDLAKVEYELNVPTLLDRSAL